MPIAVSYTLGSTPWKRTEVISRIELVGVPARERYSVRRDLEQCIERHLSRYGIHGMLRVTVNGSATSIVGNLLIVSADLEHIVGRELRHLQDEVCQLTPAASKTEILIRCFGNIDSS